MKAQFDIREFMTSFENFTLEGQKLVSNKDIHDAIEFINKTYSYDILKSITAVDREEEGIELIYHLYSTENEEEIMLSTIVRSETSTITDIYSSAQADENEIYDMFGINFLGNDDLKRLYMPENWEGYPLRKDYVQDDTRLAWNDDYNV